jgi:hypothetical protein
MAFLVPAEVKIVGHILTFFCFVHIIKNAEYRPLYLVRR